VFLAGATGVIGRRLVPLLTGSGHQVTGLARTPGAAERVRALGAEAAPADVFGPAALDRAVRAAAPDVVIHQLTGLSAGPGDANARIRRVGTRNLVDAARSAGARRIIGQSISWAYLPGPDLAAEDVPLDLDADEPRRATVAGVAALEDAVRELPEWVLLRSGLLYGPGTWYAARGTMAGRARAGELAADADVSSFVHVDDAAGPLGFHRTTWLGAGREQSSRARGPGLEPVPPLVAGRVQRVKAAVSRSESVLGDTLSPAGGRPARHLAPVAALL
jgi:nucleoside-diphosphate-sugar epimerase